MVRVTIKQKRCIVTAAYAHGATKKSVARSYNVLPNQIRRWAKEFALRPLEVLEARARKSTLHQGPRRIHGELYDEVHNWFSELRSLGIPVKLRMLVDKYRQLRLESLQPGEVLESPEVATARVWRYMKSEHLFVRRGTHVSQNIVFCESIIADYRTFINTTIRMYLYSDDDVVNKHSTARVIISGTISKAAVPQQRWSIRRLCGLSLSAYISIIRQVLFRYLSRNPVTMARCRYPMVQNSMYTSPSLAITTAFKASS